MTPIQGRDGSDLAQWGSTGGTEKWSDSAHHLKKEPTGFIDTLVVGRSKREESRVTSRSGFKQRVKKKKCVFETMRNLNTD